MRGRRWLVAFLGVAAAVALVTSRRHTLGRLVGNLRRYSAPSASLYDAASSWLLKGFFAGVAGELAEVAPELRVTGVDVAAEMVERATALAATSGVADRVRFLVGDVASLPLRDATFDVVVSTFSAHHWPDPARGLSEIHRVLRPGGRARIYDLAGWLRRLEQHGSGVADLAAGSPFGEHGAVTDAVIIRLGPVPLVERAELSH